MRDLIFISHANPEDNDFVRWLGLQLTRAGYKIWSDVTKLIAGESFWSDIESAIRDHTAKFIFVLSRASNQKQGTLDELHLAKTVGKSIKAKDFIIPLRIDDLPFSDANVAIHRLNVVDCTSSWSDGLARILQKLKEDDLAKAPGCDETAVSAWWRDHFQGDSLIRPEPEEYLSNWFPITLPTAIHVHKISEGGASPSSAFPVYTCGCSVISFAAASELGLDDDTQTHTVASDEFITREMRQVGVDLHTARDAVFSILRLAWDGCLKSLNTPSYPMSSDKTCYYFTSAILEGRKRISFDLPGILSGQRSLVGVWRKRAWHFGLSADVQFRPVLAYVIRSHVLFSDDGTSIWDSASRLHKARRSACKNWWNQHWRDRLMAAMSLLADESEFLEVPLTPSTAARVCVTPVRFMAPVSYLDADVVQNPFCEEDEVTDSGGDDEAGIEEEED